MSDSFVEMGRRFADEYLVPEGHSRDLLLHLSRLQEGDLKDLDLIVVQRAYMEVLKAIKEVYRPRSPLEAQLEYDRARKQAREEFGIVMREWNAADDPEILDRWARWSNRDEIS